MSLNPLVASENIIEKYLRYIETTFYIDNKDYMKSQEKMMMDRMKKNNNILELDLLK